MDDVAVFHPDREAFTVTVCAPSRVVLSTGVKLNATAVAPAGMVTVAGRGNLSLRFALRATVKAVVAA